MLDRLMSLLSPKTEEEHAPGDPDRVRIATCVLLLEVAGADNEFSASECERILQAMQSRFDLSQEDAEELLRVAEERRTESFDLWKFTNQINEACPNDEKTQIIEEVWRVIFADGRLDGHEDYLVHKLARLLNLNHPQLIAAKVKVMEESKGAS